MVYFLGVHGKSTVRYYHIMEAKSGNESLDQLIQQWLEWDDKRGKSYAIVQEMVIQKNWRGLEHIMTNRLKFGTAGIRGKMGAGYFYI